MQELTKEQKKIIYLFLIIAVSLFLFWFFIYSPQKKELNRIRAELHNAQREVDEIKSSSSGKTLTEAVTELEARLRANFKKLPSAEGQLIDNLTALAKKLKLDVDLIKPLNENERVIKDVVSGKELSEVPIILNLRGDFRGIGEYMQTLRNDFPYLVKAGHINLSNTIEGSPNLNINLHLYGYFLFSEE